MPEQRPTTEGLASGVELVTPELASQLLEDNRYDKQRKLVGWQVNRLKKEMQRGSFKPTSILIAFCQEDQSHYILDGQHRLQAIKEYGTPVPLFVNRIRVPTKHDLAEWYANYDQNLIRSMDNGLKVLGVAEETGIPEYQLRFVASSVRVVADGFQQGTISSSLRGENMRSVTVRARWIRDWQEEAKKYLATIFGATPNLKVPLMRQAVMSIGLVTFKYQPEFAELFWTAIAENNELKRGEPQHTLVMWLISERGMSVKNTHVHARSVAAAWNAFMDNRELSRIVVRDPTKPIYIHGTPYDGRHVIRYQDNPENPEPTEVLEQ